MFVTYLNKNYLLFISTSNQTAYSVFCLLTLAPLPGVLESSGFHGDEMCIHLHMGRKILRQMDRVCQLLLCVIEGSQGWVRGHFGVSSFSVLNDCTITNFVFPNLSQIPEDCWRIPASIQNLTDCS